MKRIDKESKKGPRIKSSNRKLQLVWTTWKENDIIRLPRSHSLQQVPPKGKTWTSSTPGAQCITSSPTTIAACVHYQLSSFQLESLSTNGFHMLRANTVALIRTTILRWQAVIPICQAKVLVGCNLLRQLLVHLVACMATVTTSNSNHTNMARLCICSCQWGLLTSRVTGDPA